MPRKMVCRNKECRDLKIGACLAAGVLAHREHPVLSGVDERHVVGLSPADHGRLYFTQVEAPVAAVAPAGRALQHKNMGLCQEFSSKVAMCCLFCASPTWRPL